MFNGQGDLVSARTLVNVLLQAPLELALENLEHVQPELELLAQDTRSKGGWVLTQLPSSV